MSGPCTQSDTVEEEEQKMSDDESQTVTEVPITVTFDSTLPVASRFSWSPNTPPDVVASLPAVTNGSPVYALIFTLESPNSPGARWPDAPVLWINENVPPPPPPTAIMPIRNETQFVVGVTNTNTTGEQQRFRFEVRVHYNGTAFKSVDPEVVLDPP
jgi:hypothetical protein